jgi:hypothetical protein
VHARAYPRVPLLAARAPPISRANCPLRSTAEYTQSMQPLRARHAAQLALPGAQLHSNPFRVHDAASANVFFIPVYASAACRETATNHGRCAAGQSAERAATRTTQRRASRAAYNMGRGCAQVTRDSAGASRTWRVPRGVAVDFAPPLCCAAHLRAKLVACRAKLVACRARGRWTKKRMNACCAALRVARSRVHRIGSTVTAGRALMVEAVRHLRSTAPYWDRSVSNQCSLYCTGTGARVRACVCRCLRLLCGQPRQASPERDVDGHK